MINCYQELTLLSQDEISIYFLWSKVFQQLHLGFVEIQNLNKWGGIGIGFPKYRAEDKRLSLGDKCRLFAADEAILERFAAPQRLSRLSDYVHCTGIRSIPGKIKGYAVYQRERPKTSPERLARRYAKRHDLDFPTALNTTVELRVPAGDASYPTVYRYCDMEVPSVALPFIRLQSLSGGQTFCLWIAKIKVAEPVAGNFSTYGLSSIATVPEF